MGVSYTEWRLGVTGLDLAGLYLDVVSVGKLLLSLAIRPGKGNVPLDL